MSKPSSFVQLFNLFVDEAREKKDVQLVANSYAGDLIDLWVNDLGPSGAARFRGFSVSPSSQAGTEDQPGILLIVRGWSLSNDKVVSFANGPTFALAAFAWLHQVKLEELNWKPDEERKQPKGVNGLLDAVSGSKGQG